MNDRPLTQAVSAIAVAAVLVFATTGQYAFGDNVVNDIAANPGSDTFTAGGSTSVGYKVVATGGDAQTGCNAADTSAAIVTINVPAGVTRSPSSLTFTACGDFQDVTFNSNTPGDYTITVSVSDSGTGTYNLTPATFTLHVLSAPSTDTTAPTIHYKVNGELDGQSPNGDNGWWNSSTVTLEWIVTEDESPGSLVLTGCDDQSITTDTASTGDDFSCSATSDGGSAGPVTVTIKRDATDPLISADRSPIANGFGWNNVDVTVSFTCSDATSDIATCPADIVKSAEGAGQSATGTAYDNAGNSASATISDINIDKTNPDVSLVGGPDDEGSYYFGSVPAVPTCNASDALSGLDGTCSVSGYSNLVGEHTVTASATDKAGNQGSDSATYDVLAWTINGFYQPIDMNGVENVAKAGKVLPVKYSLFAGPTELTNTDTFDSLIWAPSTLCSNAPAADDVEAYASDTGNTELRYDPIAHQFVENVKVPTKLGCWSLTLTTDDGSSIFALFWVKK